MPATEKHRFINRHSLPEGYLQQASAWFDPVVESLVKHHDGAKKTIIVGVNGSQGSGKTTLSDYLSISFKERGLRSVAISIDDFYLTLQQRQHLATNIHPLLITRGVPGTHDFPLALATLNALATNKGKVTIPRFSKADDDRAPREKWSKIEAPVDIIILEGWCVGIAPQAKHELVQPINQLESLHDADGKWREYVNQQLKSNYTALWELIDCMIMLQAPGFGCVYQWRLEQEQKLSQRHSLSEQANASKIMTPEQIKYFIQHYERLTRHSLLHLPQYCQHVFELSSKREIISHHSPLTS